MPGKEEQQGGGVGGRENKWKEQIKKKREREGKWFKRQEDNIIKGNE